jgi:molybdopterin-containing oxidoreductase family iron-sulfur binding subunit
VTACHEENGISGQMSGHGRPETDAQWIRKVSLRDKRTGYAQTLPLMCQHCEHPPCVDVCPTGASFKRDDGIVLVDKHTCIGCRYCVMACPYGARSFIHEAVSGQKADVPRGKGTVESCTLCVHRVDRGEIPACVEACNRGGGKAMAFGDLNDASTEIHRRLKREPSSQIRADLALNTGVRYQGL